MVSESSSQSQTHYQKFPQGTPHPYAVDHSKEARHRETVLVQGQGLALMSARCLAHLSDEAFLRRWVQHHLGVAAFSRSTDVFSDRRRLHASESLRLFQMADNIASNVNVSFFRSWFFIVAFSFNALKISLEVPRCYDRCVRSISRMETVDESFPHKMPCWSNKYKFRKIRPRQHFSTGISNEHHSLSPMNKNKLCVSVSTVDPESSLSVSNWSSPGDRVTRDLLGEN